MHPAEILRNSGKNGRFAGKHILVCVTGSIAAVEDVKLIREFIRQGAEVTVAMTESATRIVHPEALWFASGRKPITALDGDVQHVTVCGSNPGGADAVLVAPCTANMISKIATGICDDAVSTMLVTAIGAKKSIIIAPGMHGDMWQNKILQENLRKLRDLGITIVEPSLDEGKAKMAEIETIVCATGRGMLGGPLRGRKVTVIGGSTIEPIDAVRCITNASTGGTAVALAKEAYMRGADVELLMGNCAVQLPGFLPSKRFKTARDLEKLVSGKKMDIVLMPAAVSDYSPDRAFKGKMPSDKESLSIVLKRNEKVIDSIDASILVGFKLEVGISVEDLKERARERMNSSKMTAIVANRLEDVKEDSSRAFMLDRSGDEIELYGTRDEIARGIIDQLIKGLR
ncbi:MAG: bifunctional phosphopantothenoylcysteine decarboxylase/phosphopantothenate--cysteine ligase CoaBC [Thermoplasmata archaeon]